MPAWFFTLSLADRGSYLLVRHIQRLRRAYAEARHTLPFETLAVCVLPDHLHALWQLPAGDEDHGRRWAKIQSAFSPDASLWQWPYWQHRIDSDSDLARHIRHIHFNPVHHGHAREVRDWPFSSFHSCVQRGELPKKWGLVRGFQQGRFGERDEAGPAMRAPHPSPLPNGEREQVTPTRVPGSSA